MSFFDYDPHKDDPPTSPFDLLAEPVTTDPGDGCGGFTLAEMQERDLVRAALGGDESSLEDCLELLFDHWQEKWRNGEWPWHGGWPRERRDVPSIAPVLLMLGLAEPHPGKVRGKADSSGVRIVLKDWVLREALQRIKGGWYERFDAEEGYRKWQEDGAPEGVRWDPGEKSVPPRRYVESNR